MIRSGGPNSSANVHSSTSSKPGGGGMSAGSPIRAPSSTQETIVLMASSGETPVRLEVLDAHVRVIGVRRHLPVGHSLADAARPRLDFLVRREPHGGDTTFPVADDAVLVDDGGDVAGVGRRHVIILGRDGGSLGLRLSLERKNRDQRDDGGSDPSLHSHVPLPPRVDETPELSARPLRSPARPPVGSPYR